MSREGPSCTPSATVWDDRDLFVTAGQVSDYIGARALLSGLPNVKWMLADRGYDADRFREALQNKGIRDCIPGRKQRKTPVENPSRYIPAECTAGQRTSGGTSGATVPRGTSRAVMPCRAAMRDHVRQAQGLEACGNTANSVGGSALPTHGSGCGASRFFGHRLLEGLNKPVMVLDAPGLGVLTGGGATRSLIVAEIPRVLREEVYALAAMVGATIWWPARRSVSPKPGLPSPVLWQPSGSA